MMQRNLVTTGIAAVFALSVSSQTLAEGNRYE